MLAEFRSSSVVAAEAAAEAAAGVVRKRTLVAERSGSSAVEWAVAVGWEAAEEQLERFVLVAYLALLLWPMGWNEKWE